MNAYYAMNKYYARAMRKLVKTARNMAIYRAEIATLNGWFKDHDSEMFFVKDCTFNKMFENRPYTASEKEMLVKIAEQANTTLKVIELWAQDW